MPNIGLDIHEATSRYSRRVAVAGIALADAYNRAQMECDIKHDESRKCSYLSTKAWQMNLSFRNDNGHGTRHQSNSYQTEHNDDNRDIVMTVSYLEVDVD